jgi:hydroxyacylglutathione hydrolase
VRLSRSVEPGNAELEKMMAFCRDKGLSKGVSVPTTMAWERAANPFVNTSSPTLMAACGCSEPVDVFASMRERKNSYSPPASGL